MSRIADTELVIVGATTNDCVFSPASGVKVTIDGHTPYYLGGDQRLVSGQTDLRRAPSRSR